jgi:hypothetical protein
MHIFEAQKVDFHCIATEYQRAHPEKEFQAAKSLFLEPEIMSEAIAEYHQKNSLQWSWGGFFEDRTELWRGSYLSGDILHAGIDVNLPVRSQIYAPCAGKLLLVDDDEDPSGGWGLSVALEPDLQLLSVPVILIFAHIDEIALCSGDRVEHAAPFARIASANVNGGWWPHLHIQAVEKSFYQREQMNAFPKLDGYFDRKQREVFEKVYLDPSPYLKGVHTS